MNEEQIQERYKERYSDLNKSIALEQVETTDMKSFYRGKTCEIRAELRFLIKQGAVAVEENKDA